MFENLIEILKANPRKIVYTEGTDARILESAARLKKGGFLTPVLVGNVEAVKAAAAKGGFDIEGLEILDPTTYERMDEMIDTMVALRKGKMTAEESSALLKKGNYYGAWLMGGGEICGWMGLGDLGDVAVEQIRDFDCDGKDDLRIRTAGGDLGVQLVKGADTLEWKYYGSVGSEWNTALAALG